MKEAEYGFKAIKTEQTGTLEQINLMQIVPDSQFYTTLEMIKENLKSIQQTYVPAEKPEHNFISWPPTTIEHLLIGIENTIKNGYEIAKKIN